ncbi:HAMP domain-containing sensor histidine kinase [Nocardia sp. NPDC046763]|uniref:sensor histidine kinase n=1 Tax=Nocardia sp. NPDC046763 TaxID=3155256 RepID=UPI0033D64C28
MKRAKRGRAIPPARRLRYAPWIAVAVLTGFATVTLSGFAAVDLITQEHADTARLDAELNTVASAAAHEVASSPAGAVPQGFSVYTTVADAVTYQGHGLSRIDGDCPQFAVVFATSVGTQEFRSARHCTHDLDEIRLQDMRARAVRTRVPVQVTIPYPGGAVRAVATPVDDWRYDHFGGAAIAWADLGPDHARQRQITALTCGLTAALIASFGLMTYLLTAQLLPARIRAVESQEDILAGVAHDLRAPIAALCALAETARDHPDQRTELLDRTVRLSRRMGDIVEDLLSRARLTAGIEEMETQPLRLDQIVLDLIEEIDSDAAIFTSTTAPTVVNGAPTLLCRAIRNLLDNAVRHGHLPGEPARVHVTVAGGRVIVADRGPGLVDSDRDSIFEAFHSNAGSTGLGLPIARWVAHAHGGTLDVHSADGGGAIFEFALPTPAREL